jgi:peptide deformylase
MKTSILSILFVLLLSSCSHIQPTVEHIANERVVASENCDKLVALFFNVSRATLEIPTNSFLGKNTQFVQKMESIRLSSIDYSKYYQDFFSMNKRPPTLRDALTYIDTIKNKTIENYTLIIYDLERLPDFQSPDVQLFYKEVLKAKTKVSKNKTIEQFGAELIASYEKGKTTIPNIDAKITVDDETGALIDDAYFQYLKVVDTLTAFQGEYGELMAMATSKDKVIIRGLKFNNSGSSNALADRQIAEKVVILENRVKKMTNEEVIEFINPHKEGLFREAYAELEHGNFSMENRNLVINKIFRMIRDKEIDLVTEDSNGKVTWAEVKAYNKPVTMNLINHGSGKSILDQLIEHKALRDVLGLESSVKLRFVSSISIVDEEAKQAIRNVGYEIISAK